jgi:hypothetical protein
MQALDTVKPQDSHSVPVLQNTMDTAVSRPDSAALSRPYSVKVLGGMGLSVRQSARLYPCFEHPAHPALLQNCAGGFLKLIQEPETMTTPKVGTHAAAYAPAFMRRLAHQLASRAALRRAELRARAYAAVAADRLNRGGAA